MSKIMQVEPVEADQQVRRAKPGDPAPDDQTPRPAQQVESNGQHVHETDPAKANRQKAGPEDGDRRVQRLTRVGLLAWGNAFLALGMIDGVYNAFPADVLFFGVTGCGLLYMALTGKWPKVSGND